MKISSAALGAVGALLVGGAAFGLGVTTGVGFSATPASAQSTSTAEAPTLSGWRADAWETYTVGIEDMTDTREGFDQTYLGTYSTKPADRVGRVILESVRHPGIFHVFAIQNPAPPARPTPSV